MSEPPSASLSGRVAVVTGAARGLGLGVARHLAAAGASVVVADVLDSEDVTADLAGEGRHRSAALDVTDAAGAEAIVSRVLDEFGRLDIWVNNAGVVGAPQPVLDTTTADVRHMLDVNVIGVLNGARAAVRGMRACAAPAGRLINVSSARARIAWAGLGVYGATKAAVLSLTQAMALELAPEGITVNAVLPGTMWTNMAETAFGQMAVSTGTPLAELKAHKIGQIPVGRFGTPDDVGALVAFLASDSAGFITGAAHNLTGGEDQF